MKVKGSVSVGGWWLMIVIHKGDLHTVWNRIKTPNSQVYTTFARSHLKVLLSHRNIRTIQSPCLLGEVVGRGVWGGSVLWDYLQRNLIAKSIKCWLLLALLPIVNKWFWQYIQTGKSISVGFFFCGVGLLYSCKHGKWFSSHLRARLPHTTGGLPSSKRRRNPVPASHGIWTSPIPIWHMQILGFFVLVFFGGFFFTLFSSGCPRSCQRRLW